MTERERRLRTNLKGDFAFYAPRALRIRTKAGAVKPFALNTAQEHLHAALERQRAETGKVRAIVLKGRQQGCSTYVQGRFFWRVTQTRGVRAFILTHLDDATNNLFGMAKRFHENCPALVKPSLRASNAKELIFDRLDSGYKIGTAGSAGVGRSDTIQLFHGSEAAYWPNAEKHMAGALQAVPDEPGTEVILESTSAGPMGVFYDRAMQAMNGQGDYRLVFIPWFWQPEYHRDIPPDFEMTGEETIYAEAFGVSRLQIAWRRAKVVELGGLHNFRREYPATPDEAFRVEAPGALWKRPLLDELRVHAAPKMRRIVVAVDPSGGAGPQNNEAGIVVAGKGVDGDAYILEDGSAKFTPNEWGAKAVALFDRHRADRVVGERNYGGDMVESTIRTIRRTVSYKDVNATRGKAVRAEPVKALYEQGRVHHVGMFPALEDEMVTWQPEVSKFSPNRLDALVWALTELMLDPELSGAERMRILAS